MQKGLFRFQWRHALLSGLICAFLANITPAQVLLFTSDLYELMEERYGADARERVFKLEQLIGELQGQPHELQLSHVNQFFNQIEYAFDADQWDQKDFWATPFEVLGVNTADCEDYAISKFFTLLAVGIPEDRLRITYVKALTTNQAHMVLAYYPTPDADPLILDNLIGSIKLASTRTDLEPVWSFNGSALWVAVNGGMESEQERGADRLSQWIRFNSRLREQMGETEQ